MDGGYSPWNQPRIIDRNRNGNIVSLPTSSPVKDVPITSVPVSSSALPAPSASAISTGVTPTMPRFAATPARTRAGFDSAIDAEQHDVTCDPVAFWRGLGVGLLLSLIVWSAVIAAIVQ